MKYIDRWTANHKIASPSPRRAWIEIRTRKYCPSCIKSPSPRRAWIEIILVYFVGSHLVKSPSPRRAWIEIARGDTYQPSVPVALPTEGVD